MSRMKSWAMWLALGALVVWVVKTVCGEDISDQVNECLSLLCPILVGFGIVNNPTDKSSI